MDTEFYERLLNASFHFVSFRPRSEMEIRAYLAKKAKKYSTNNNAVIARVIERLRELDYINDEKFAKYLIAGRQGHAPKGQRVIRQELLQKGVDKVLIESIFSEYRDDADAISQTDLAKKAIQKKIKTWSIYPDPVKKKKCYEFLFRRGFDAQTISSVIDDLMGKDYNTTME
jgi:regulatory protein